MTESKARKVVDKVVDSAQETVRDVTDEAQNVVDAAVDAAQFVAGEAVEKAEKVAVVVAEKAVEEVKERLAELEDFKVRLLTHLRQTVGSTPEGEDN